MSAVSASWIVGVRPVPTIGMIGIAASYVHLPVSSAHISIATAKTNPAKITNKYLFLLNLCAAKTRIKIIPASTAAALTSIKDVIDPP